MVPGGPQWTVAECVSSVETQCLPAPRCWGVLLSCLSALFTWRLISSPWNFLFDPLACLKGNTTLTDKICIFWLSKTITLCKCHPDVEVCGCQGNIMGDNLIAAVNCILSSPGVKPALPEMPALVLGYFIFRKQTLEK